MGMRKFRGRTNISLPLLRLEPENKEGTSQEGAPTLRRFHFLCVCFVISPPAYKLEIFLMQNRQFILNGLIK